jgi:hypothetical protein
MDELVRPRAAEREGVSQLADRHERSEGIAHGLDDTGRIALFYAFCNSASELSSQEVRRA